MLDLQLPFSEESVHLTLEFHHFPRIGAKWLFALAHLGCSTPTVDTSVCLFQRNIQTISDSSV